VRGEGVGVLEGWMGGWICGMRLREREGGKREGGGKGRAFAFC